MVLAPKILKLEITDFKSQKAYLTINQASVVVSLDDQKTTIKEVISSAGVGFKSGHQMLDCSVKVLNM